jgi:hypothetical protein
MLTPRDGGRHERTWHQLCSRGWAAELERLRLQARVWDPETERWLDEIGIQHGWVCADLGCGAMGVIGPLSRRAGGQSLGTVEIVENNA